MLRIRAFRSNVSVVAGSDCILKQTDYKLGQFPFPSHAYLYAGNGVELGEHYDEIARSLLAK